MMNIREIQVNDAKNFSELLKNVDAQSPFMLYEEGERSTSNEKEKKRIVTMLEKKNAIIFVVESDQKLIGYVASIRGNTKRNKHVAYVVIGLLQQYRGKGIGRKLFNKLDEWAVNNTISRLELTVVTKNDTAVNLYKKCGFEIEGIKRKAFKWNNTYIDEYYMAKLI
jgi:RimJ/RimL family protein N-acetyltransferase